MTRGIHWFRQDLRIRDNTALHALSGRADELLPVFILDPRLLAGRGRTLPRSRFLLASLRSLDAELAKRGSALVVRSGRPEVVLPELVEETRASLLSFNQSGTPYSQARDEKVRRAATKAGAELIERSDHVIFDAEEIRTQAGGPYSVYTPYRNAWWRSWHDTPRLPVAATRLPAPIAGVASDPVPDDEPGEGAELRLPTAGEAAARRRLDAFLEGSAARYAEDRDRPDRDGTSRLSPYLRFGALSPRVCFERALAVMQAEPRARTGIGKWLDELIWREFYAAILKQNPRVLNENHRREYDALVWNHDPQGFDAWCRGLTGFPIVDAGMRQLRATGWMHNRVRMVVASFLTKDLLVDWRLGARFFFDSLLDGDPASNSGGWQWAASTGTDAQPYFRIFNPTSQGKKCDPDGTYVRRWVPELRGLPSARIHEPWRESPPPLDYPAPIVDHAERRREALARFGEARGAEATSP